jgi:ion channel-forming bestrophin family protein
MHIGKSYRLREFLIWTKRTIFLLVILGTVPVFLYQVVGLKWLAIPWPVVGLLGTATAFIVGFKNTMTYNRSLEAQQIWVSIANNSKTWGTICRDYLSDAQKSKELVHRHFAWLTTMRYQLREQRAWETTSKKHNSNYRKFYTIPEEDALLETELAKYLHPEELRYILNTKSPSTQIMSLQSKGVKELLNNGDIVINFFLEMQKVIKDFYDLQGRSERIKNFPYPRQYSVINSFFINLFCVLLPFGILKEFDNMNEHIEGAFRGNMVWLVIPFSVIISWMYTSLEQVGESTENPFEGSANDVPISHISRSIEIDLREMLGEKDLPPYLQPKNNIIL